MSLEATVLAIVPFNPSIASHLNESQEAYTTVPPGTPVVSELFHIRTSSASRELAKQLNVNLSNPATYVVDPKTVQSLGESNLRMHQLRQLCEVAGEPGDADAFVALAKVPGTQFFFRAH